MVFMLAKTISSSFKIYKVIYMGHPCLRDRVSPFPVMYRLGVRYATWVVSRHWKIRLKLKPMSC
jgi:hypothetical protein